MNRLFIFSVLVFSLGSYSGWEVRGKFENNPAIKVTKMATNWIGQLNPLKSKESNCGGNK